MPKTISDSLVEALDAAAAAAPKPPADVVCRLRDVLSPSATDEGDAAA